MSFDDTQPDDRQRRAFKPPRQRRRRERKPRGTSFNLWEMREGFGYGLTRALCAVGFGFVPGVSDRLGDSALTVVSSLLAAMMVAIFVGLIRLGRAPEWRLIADAVALFVLVPVLVTASGIEVADARLGGRSSNFLAAAVALVLIYAITAIIATRGGADRNAASQIGALPGALSIAVVVLGTTHFSASAIWRGLSIAWMVAAVATVLAMFVPLNLRALVAPVVFLLFTVGVVVPDFLSENEAILDAGSAGIAMVTVVVVALVLLFIPSAPRRTRRIAPPPDGTGDGAK